LPQHNSLSPRHIADTAYLEPLALPTCNLEGGEISCCENGVVKKDDGNGGNLTPNATRQVQRALVREDEMDCGMTASEEKGCDAAVNGAVDNRMDTCDTRQRQHPRVGNNELDYNMKASEEKGCVAAVNGAVDNGMDMCDSSRKTAEETATCYNAKASSAEGCDAAENGLRLSVDMDCDVVDKGMDICDSGRTTAIKQEFAQHLDARRDAGKNLVCCGMNMSENGIFTADNGVDTADYESCVARGEKLATNYSTHYDEDDGNVAGKSATEDATAKFCNTRDSTNDVCHEKSQADRVLVEAEKTRDTPDDDQRNAMPCNTEGDSDDDNDDDAIEVFASDDSEQTRIWSSMSKEQVGILRSPLAAIFCR